MSNTDVYLLEDLAKGDKLAFDNIFKEYSLALYRFIYRKLANQAKAENLTKELFLALINYAKEWQKEPSLKLLLYSLAIKRCNKLLAKDLLSSTENLDLTQKSLAKLDQQSNNIVLLSEYQHLSCIEIAKILKIELEDVKEKLLIAKEFLASELLAKKFEVVNQCLKGTDVQPFLNEELPTEKAKELELHIVDCSSCQERANKLKMVSEALETWSVPEPNLVTAHELFTISQIKPGFLSKNLSKRYTLPLFILLLVMLLYFFPKDLLSYQEAKEKSSLPQASETVPVPPPSRPPAAPSPNYETTQTKSLSINTASLDAGVEGGVAGGVIGGVVGNVAPAPSSVNMSVKDISLPQKQAFDPPKMSLSQLKDGERLIVKTASLWIETDKFDDAKNSIADLAKSKGGFLNKLYVTTQSGTRTAQIIFKVPSRNFDQTIVELRKYGKVTQESIEGQDVTDQYFDAIDDVEANKELDKVVSGQNPSRNLSAVDIEQQHLQIRKHNTQLKRYISELRQGADLATITFNLHEITKDSEIIAGTKELSTWGQIKQSFFNGFNNLFAILLPILLFAEEAGFSIIFFGAVTVLVYLLIDRYIRKSSNQYPSDFNDWRG